MVTIGYRTHLSGEAFDEALDDRANLHNCKLGEFYSIDFDPRYVFFVPHLDRMKGD